MRGVAVFHISGGLFSTFIANQRCDWEKRMYLRYAIVRKMTNGDTVYFFNEETYLMSLVLFQFL